MRYDVCRMRMCNGKQPLKIIENVRSN